MTRMERTCEQNGARRLVLSLAWLEVRLRNMEPDGDDERSERFRRSEEQE